MVDCLAQALDGLVEAALLQQASAEFLVPLGVRGLRFEGAAQEGLGFLAAALAIERRAEQRRQIRLAGKVGKGGTADLFRHRRHRLRAGR